MISAPFAVACGVSIFAAAMLLWMLAKAIWEQVDDWLYERKKIREGQLWRKRK